MRWVQARGNVFDFICFDWIIFDLWQIKFIIICRAMWRAGMAHAYNVSCEYHICAPLPAPNINLTKIQIQIQIQNYERARRVYIVPRTGLAQTCKRTEMLQKPP